MAPYAQHLVVTSQSEQADSRQVKNSAGGYAFQITPWQRLERFLVLGNEGGTYYASEQKLTLENARCVEACLAEDAERTVRTIVDVSQAGRAPKNDPAIFALALATKRTVGRTQAYAAVSKVCRTGTHLFQFAQTCKMLRGWGRGLRRAIGGWYTSKTPDKLCYQVAKYRQRDGMSHGDLLRLTHPDSTDSHAPIYRWCLGKDLDTRVVKRQRGEVVYPSVGVLPEYLEAFAELRKADRNHACELIHQHRFTHEMVPSELKKDPAIWEALLEHMPMTAMIRNLATMTANGLLKPLSNAAMTICERLGDMDRLRKARVHPIQVLSALTIYARGYGARGNLRWEPVQPVVDALDAAFYKAFGNVEPSNKRTMLALDVSGSMGTGAIAGVPGLSPRVASAAMAMVTANTEPNWMVLMFADGFRPLNLSPRNRLDEVVNAIRNLPFGNTDCALPMLAAEYNKLDVDTFVVYTDNETWFGNIHPHQALNRYRQSSGNNARLAVVACTATNFSIADPSDPGMLDVVGFDTATPNLLTQFAKGEI